MPEAYGSRKLASCALGQRGDDGAHPRRDLREIAGQAVGCDVEGQPRFARQSLEQGLHVLEVTRDALDGPCEVVLEIGQPDVERIAPPAPHEHRVEAEPLEMVPQAHQELE